MAQNIQQTATALNQLITQLEAARSTLEATGGAAKNLDRAIAGLKQMAATQVFPRDLESQIRKFNKALEEQLNIQIRLGQVRLRTGQFKDMQMWQRPRVESGEFDLKWPAGLKLTDRQIEHGKGNAIPVLTQQLKDAGVQGKALEKILEDINKKAALHTGGFEEIGKKINIDPVAGKDFDKLTFTMLDAAGNTEKFNFALDSTRTELADTKKKAADAIPPLEKLKNLLKEVKVSTKDPTTGAPIKETMVPGAQGMVMKEVSQLYPDMQGISMVTKEVADGFTRITMSVKTAAGGVQQLTRYTNDMGEVLMQIPEKYAGQQGFMNIFEPGQEVKMDRAAAVVKKYGFNLGQLKTVTTEASTGIKTMNFSVQEGENFWRKATLHIDKFGNVLTDTQKRFRSFGDGIKRNIGESLKWMVAIGVVYGSFQKLQQVVTEAIDNQARLADIGVVLGKSQEELGTVFNNAYQAAQLVGEGLDGVIEGYAGAYRAAGSYKDQAERSRVATQLLTDAIILSKLSSLDQAEALDTLAGALRQTGLGLDQGQILLNKWIAVSKEANVDLKTLAESFAITSTTAENAGLSFDQLNAVIATVAETTTLSATEAGNAVRAFISGFQTDNARDALMSFGIAVEDTNGEARDFLDVMYDIADLSSQGLISEDQLNKIAEAIGGGARRGAQVMAFIENLQRVAEITAVSMEAEGEVLDALDIKLETVQTSLTRLDNAFQNLATSMGTEGGILSASKLVVDGLTGLLDVLSKVTESLGTATPLLMALGGAMLYVGKNSRAYDWTTALGGRLGVGVGRVFGRYRNDFAAEADAYNSAQMSSFMGAPPVTAQGLAMQQRQAVGTRLAPWAGPGIGMGIMAISNIKEKDWEGLGGQIAGGIIGAPFGPMGMMIGSMIGDVAANTLLEYDKDFSKMFVDIWTESAQAAKGGAEDTAKSIEEREAALLEKVISKRGGGAGANIEKWRTQFVDWIGDTLGIQTLDILKEGIEIPTSAIAKRGLEEDVSMYKQKLAMPDYMLTEGAREFYTAQLEEAQALLAALKDIEIERERMGETPKEDLTTPYGRRVAAGAEERSSEWMAIEAKLVEDYTDKLNKQEITVKEYNEAMDRMQANGLLVNQVYEAMGKYAEEYGLTFEETSRLVVSSNDEQAKHIIALKGEIAELYDELVKAQAAGDIRVAVRIGEDLGALQEQLAAFNEELYKAQRMADVQLTSPFELDVEDMDSFNAVMEEAMNIFRERMQENIRLGLIPDDATEQEVLDAYEDVFLQIAKLGISEMKDIPEDILKEAYDKLKEAGTIKTSDTKSKFRVQTADMSQGDFMSSYNSWMAKVSSAFGEYWSPELEDIGMIFNDGMEVMHLDNLIMQLAMQDLIDVSEKQLDGIYNLPTDTSFYVPFQGYQKGFVNQGGGGGGLDLAAVSELFEKLLATQTTAKPQGEDFRGWWDKYYEDVGKKDAWHAPMALPKEDQPVTGGMSLLEKQLSGTLGEDFATRQRLMQEMGAGGSIGDTQMPQDLTFMGVVREMSNAVKSIGNLSTNLRLEQSTNVSLTLDGRVVAAAILPYLYEELIRYENTAGGVTTNKVI